jgi:hypothetical protein
LHDRYERSVGRRIGDRVGHVGRIDGQKVDDGRPGRVESILLQVDEGQHAVGRHGLVRRNIVLVEAGGHQAECLVVGPVQILVIGGGKGTFADDRGLGVCLGRDQNRGKKEIDRAGLLKGDETRA